MPACSMCETPLRDGADACLACGTHVAQTPSARAGEGQVRVALDTARRAEAAESAQGLDVSTAKRLIAMAESRQAGGDRPRALDFARAAKRAVEIARRRARIEAEIARAEARIQQVREGGIDTMASGHNLELAREAVQHGAYAEAEKLLARASLKALEVREAKQIRSLIDRAAKQIAHAKERGADISSADEALGSARKAAAAGAVREARRNAESAIDTASGAPGWRRLPVPGRDHSLHGGPPGAGLCEVAEPREGGCRAREGGGRPPASSGWTRLPLPGLGGPPEDRRGRHGVRPPREGREGGHRGRQGCGGEAIGPEGASRRGGREGGSVPRGRSNDHGDDCRSHRGEPRRCDQGART